jgi:hypothetical protein
MIVEFKPVSLDQKSVVSDRAMSPEREQAFLMGRWKYISVHAQARVIINGPKEVKYCFTMLSPGVMDVESDISIRELWHTYLGEVAFMKDVIEALRSQPVAYQELSGMN